MPGRGFPPPLHGADKVVVVGGSGDLRCQDKVSSCPCGPFASVDKTAPGRRRTGRCGRRRWDDRQEFGARGCLSGQSRTGRRARELGPAVVDAIAEKALSRPKLPGLFFFQYPPRPLPVHFLS